MAKLVIVSLGTLSGALLESAARRARFDEIVVASSDFEKAKAKAKAIKCVGNLKQISLSNYMYISDTGKPVHYE